MNTKLNGKSILITAGSSGCVKALNFPYSKGIYHIGIEKNDKGKRELYILVEEHERRQDPDTEKERTTEDLAKEDYDTITGILRREHIERPAEEAKDWHKTHSKARIDYLKKKLKKH